MTLQLNEFGTRTENCDGHRVNAHFGPHTGWRPVSHRFQTREEAVAAMEACPDIGYELCVFESLMEPRK